MGSINIAIVKGRLTRDPEKRTTPSGLSVVDLQLASNSKHKTSAGELREDVLFIGVTVWGKSGDACAEYLRKGNICTVIGRLKLDQWEKDGQKRSKISIIADQVDFGEKRDNDQGQRAQPERTGDVQDKGDDIPF